MEVTPAAPEAVAMAEGRVKIRVKCQSVAGEKRFMMLEPADLTLHEFAGRVKDQFARRYKYLPPIDVFLLRDAAGFDLDLEWRVRDVIQNDGALEVEVVTPEQECHGAKMSVEELISVQRGEMSPERVRARLGKRKRSSATASQSVIVRRSSPRRIIAPSLQS
jgi:hypothetical protein